MTLLRVMLIAMFLFVPGVSSALLPEHNDYNGCSTCHDLHGAPSSNPFGSSALLSELTPEALCLSCHGPLGIATEAAVHGTTGQVTCLECHNPHNNDSINVLGYPNHNIMLVGGEYDVKIQEETTGGLGLRKPVVFQISPDDWHRPSDGYGVCDVCHTSIHNEGENCNACHAHNNGFAGTGCTGCHNGGGAGALTVGPGSAHSETLTGYTCEDCHVGHAAGTIEIPNYNAVGINYGSNDETGISLGSDVATGNTEAQICWNCHDLHGVSEWETNTHAATGGSSYNYGMLDQSNWNSAEWSSANFPYKKKTIQSTHSVNPAVAAPGVDAVDLIRCSYCHDVHELAMAPNDTAAGKPYLRGSWKGNPYREDGAPSATSTYTARHWGFVPRGSILNNEYGGYQIDQNNGYPTSGGVAPTWNAGTSSWVWPAGLWTLSESAGLCILCHGEDIDSMNQFGVASVDWVGENGHSNSAIGGTASVASNIFRTSLRAPKGVDTLGAKPDMGYRNHGTSVGYGFRGTDGRAFDILNPTMDGQLSGNPTRPYGGSFYQWGAFVDDVTTEKKYHQFSCSKCHNPHASRLPRLMITNCLDTVHNTWDDPRVGINAVDQALTNQNGITLSATSTPDNWGRTWSNTTSAQNCHRLAGDNRVSAVPGFGTGWNNVTPW